MNFATVCAALALVFSPAAAQAANVGFSELRVANGDGKPLAVGVWYPTGAAPEDRPIDLYVQHVAPNGPVEGHRLPLIVVSHGNGGALADHFDTAVALAEAGFVVAAVSHTGDTHGDQSRAAYIMDRSQHIKRLIDFMLNEWSDHARIDAGRVGMFGFSSGGTTALISIGGVPDLRLTEAHALAHPDYYDAQMAKRLSLAFVRSDAPRDTWVRDTRIKAAVIAAPAMGYAFGRLGLKEVSVPIQLWRAESDHILPHPDYAEAVRIALPTPPEYHVVPNADHFDFMTPCSEALRQRVPQICISHPGFDRAAFHQTFNREVVRFFEEKLR
jgi:predicted dienelactone hydrolase